jgi:hypothetical protein
VCGAILVIFASTHPAAAQVSPNVPLGDPLYEYLDGLADLGLAPSYMRGTRPVTCDYAARVVREATGVATARGGPEPGALAAARELLLRLRPHRRGVAAGGGQAEAGIGMSREVLDQPPASHDERVGYLAPRNGSELATGEGFALGLAVRGSLGPVAAAEATAGVGFPDGTATTRLRRAYLKLGWGALEVEAGRDALVWGQGRHAALQLSGLAPAFDLVSLRTARPVALPWVLRYLGATQVVLFLARMDQQLPYPRPWLVGTRLALKPQSWLEIGFGRLLAFGGEGEPRAGAAGMLGEFFGWREDVYASNYANHSLSTDIHVRVRDWFQVYGEWYLEDCCAAVLGQDSSVLVGVRRARLFAQGDGLAVEFAHSSRVAFLSSDTTPEWNQGHVLTGHPLGPAGTGAYALYTLLGSRGEVLKARLGLERRGAPYDIPVQPEWRAGGLVEVRVPLRPGTAGRVDARGRLGLERVVSVQRVIGDDRTAGIAELGVEAAF